MLRTRILVLLSSTLFTFLLVELFIRSTNLWVPVDSLSRNSFHQSAVRDQSHTYLPKLNRTEFGTQLITNSLGLRDSREPSQLQNECYRILIVGGSITAGYGVDNNQTYPALLEAELNKKNNSCFEVINAGQLGYSAHDTYKLLKNILPIYKPQLILFAVNMFAMNSTLAVGPEQKLGFADFIYTFDYLLLYWHIRAVGYDVTQKYNPDKHSSFLYQLAGSPLPSFLDSYAIRYFTPLFLQFLHKLNVFSIQPTCETAHCLYLKPEYTTSQGLQERLPTYSAIYYSPHHQKKLYETLNKSIQLANDSKTPMVFFTIESYLDPKRLNTNSSIALTGSTEVLTTMTSKDLFEKHNLVWDFHLTNKGNLLLAQGLKNYLSSQHLVPSQNPTNFKSNYHEYISAQQREEKRNFQYFYPSIHIKEQRNIHQIIAGIHLNSSNHGRYASLLLRKKQQKSLQLKIENKITTPYFINVNVIAKNKTLKKEVLLPATGALTTELDISKLADGLIDIEVICSTKICDLRYHSAQLKP